MENHGSGKEAAEGKKRGGNNPEFDRTISEKRELEETFNKINRNRMDFIFLDKSNKISFRIRVFFLFCDLI